MRHRLGNHSPPNDNGNVSSTPPLSCPVGHLLAGGRVLVGWYPCGCSGSSNGGHHTWICGTRLDLGRDPASYVIYDGRHDLIESGAGPQHGPDLQSH